VTIFENGFKLKKLWLRNSTLLVSILSLAYFPLLFHFRYLDDNALTNWKWVFQETHFVRTFLFFMLLTVVAGFLSQFEILATKPALLFLIPVVCLVVPGWGIPEVILDTSRYFIQAKYLELYGLEFFFNEWGNTIQAWTDLPLVPLVYGLIFKLVGEIRLPIQIWNTALYYATILLTVNLGKKLWNERVGLLAGSCLLGMPYLLTQVPLMLVDISTMFFFTLSMFCSILALEKGGRLPIVLSSTTIVLAALTKFSIWPLFIFLPVIAFVYFTADNRKFVPRSQFVIRTAWILGLCLIQVGFILWYKQDLLINQLGFLVDYQWAGLSRWRESYSSTFFFQSHPIIACGALYGLICAVKERDGGVFLTLCFILLIHILRLHRIRYLIPLLPIYALIGGYRIYQIRSLKIQNFLTLFMIGSSFVIVHVAYYPFLETNSFGNLQKAGEYINKIKCTQILVSTHPQKESIGNTAIALPILDLFTSKEILYAPSTASVDPEKVRKASLRFTWEYQIPEYYQKTPPQTQVPVLIISSEKKPEKSPFNSTGIPPDPVLKRYNTSSGVFRFKTLVSIFGEGCDVNGVSN